MDIHTKLGCYVACSAAQSLNFEEIIPTDTHGSTKKIVRGIATISYLDDAGSRLVGFDGTELVVVVLVHLRHARLHEARVQTNDGDPLGLDVKREDLAHHVLRALAHVVPGYAGNILNKGIGIQVVSTSCLPVLTDMVVH